MTPVAKTGLHCGATSVLHPRPQPRVTPVAKTGLHCGEDAHDAAINYGLA